LTLLHPRPRWSAVLAALFFASALVEAGVPLYQSGDGLDLELGLKVQLQYYHLGGDGFSKSELFFRRLRPSLEATFSPSIAAEAEFDFGKTVEGEEIEFKDLFVSYSGLASGGFVIEAGNGKPVFSRQFQSSSRSLTLAERGFVGIDDFGSLDRVLGVRVDGRDRTKKVVVAASAALASHEPDASQMEFESPLNAGDDANRGWSFSGRVELQPLGEVDYDQGDLEGGRLRFALAAAAYRWSNDGSNNLHTQGSHAMNPDAADLARARGVELGGALRGRGLSADAEFQWVRGEAVDPDFGGGLYRDGEVALSKISLQSGYMVSKERVEIVGGYDRLDAETYGSAWKRLTLGATYYWKGNGLKLQGHYILHWSFSGAPGDDPQAFVTQFQVAF
jgi:hypothetical protein